MVECIHFFCPACREYHGVHVTGPHKWEWNRNLERPTLTPSLLITKEPGYRCHFFVTDGHFQYAPDCLHPLAGKTVFIPEDI